ncbi:hypothetical protein RB597_007787 [Gaeumannomyces tritici]
MGDGRPTKRAKRHGATGTTPKDPTLPSITIPIPITNRPPPSHYPTYVPGSGPPSSKIRLQPETDDTTSYIIDKLVLPAGPLPDSKAQRRYYYLVGWTDIPAARVAIDCSKAQEYLTPRCIEDWEFEDCLRREREQQEAAFEAIKNAPVRKKAGRPPKNRILADADEVQAEEQALRSSQPSLSGPSLSTPQKTRATGLIPGDVESEEHDNLNIDLDSDGEPIEFYDAEDIAAEDSMDIDEVEDEDDDDMLQKVLLEQARRNARAEELDDDYDELAAGRTIVRLDDAPVSQYLPGRIAKSKLANAYAPLSNPASVAPSLPANAASTKKKGSGTDRGPGRWPKGTKASDYGGTGVPSLARPEVAARVGARQQREPAVASSSSSAAVLPPMWYVSNDDDDDDAHSAAAPERSPSPEYTGKGKQAIYTFKGKEPVYTFMGKEPVYVAKGKEPIHTDKSKEPVHPDKGQEPVYSDKAKGKESVWPIFQTQVQRPRSVSTAPFGTKNDTSNNAEGGTDSVVAFQATEATPAQTVDGQPLYEVEQLEGVKIEIIDGAAVYFFLVRWKGDWSDDINPSWEPQENLDSRLVRRFLKAHKKAAQEESARMMMPPPPPPRITAAKPMKPANRQVAEPDIIPVLDEAGNGATAPNIASRGIISQTSRLTHPVIKPPQTPSQRRATGSSSFTIASPSAQDDEEDFDMEDADGDKDEAKELRRMGLANGSYQPPMGVHLLKPVLPKSVRDSLPRALPRSSRK